MIWGKVGRSETCRMMQPCLSNKSTRLLILQSFHPLLDSCTGPSHERRVASLLPWRKGCSSFKEAAHVCATLETLLGQGTVGDLQSRSAGNAINALTSRRMKPVRDEGMSAPQGKYRQTQATLDRYEVCGGARRLKPHGLAIALSAPHLSPTSECEEPSIHFRPLDNIRGK